MKNKTDLLSTIGFTDYLSKKAPWLLSQKTKDVLDISRNLIQTFAKMTPQEKQEVFAQKDSFMAIIRNRFITTFLEDKEMLNRLMSGLSFFFQINFNKLSDIYSEYKYVPEAFDGIPGCELSNIGLNILYNAALSGDVNAVEILKTLYKERHRKEYNALKKFSKLTYIELSGIVPDSDDFTMKNYCRAICMSELMGIKIDESLPGFVAMLIKASEPKLTRKAASGVGMVVSHEEFFYEYKIHTPELNQCYDKAYELLSQDNFRKKLLEEFKFINAVLNMQGSPDMNVRFYIEESFDKLIWDCLAEIMYVLDALKRAYDEDSLPFYAAVMLFSKDYTARLDSMEYQAETLLGLNFDKDDELTREMLEKIKTPKEAVKREDKPVNLSETDLESRIKSLEEENRDLRRRLQEKESRISNLYDELKDERKERIKNEIESREFEEMKRDLASLREFEYTFGDDDEENAVTISEEDMIKEISALKIAIVGGNQNWVKKIKQKLPEARFYPAKVQSTATAQAVKDMDMVYFFSDTISHSEFYKFVEYCKSYDIEPEYIHGVSIKRNIQFIYYTLKKQNKLTR